MSPKRIATPTTPAVDAMLNRFWVRLGSQAREARLSRGLTVHELAQRAGVTRWVVYILERGEAISLEAVARIANAVGLRLEAELVDARRKRLAPLAVEPVHSAMAEFEAGWFKRYAFGMGVDEPYQHYQFAGRADFVAWHVEERALLHIENRTRFPDIQETAGSFNAKRAYLGQALADRFGIGKWASETHVIAALWSSEVLHSLRLRTATFRSLCPDDVAVFNGWWHGMPLARGRQSTFVVLDPKSPRGTRPYVGLEQALSSRPRYRGYADAASAIMAAQ